MINWYCEEKMSKIEAVRDMQTYIEKHLCEKITLADLARISNYSPWHSYRIFIEYLKLSPSDYTRRLKLSKSALELRDKKKKIIDIAYEYGYESVDGYQRAFYKEFGANPLEYAKNPFPICIFYPYKIYEKKEKKEVKEVHSVFISVINKPAHKVIIKRGIKATHYFDYCEEVGCDVWGILTSMKSLCGEPVCLWLPKKYIKEGTSEYVQGVEVPSDYNGEIPEGFEVIDLPESTYLMFQGEPFEEEDYEQAISDIWKAMEKYNPEPLGFIWDNENPKIQLEPRGERGYIELKAVKKIK